MPGRNKVVNARLPHAKEIRFLTILLGEPPTVLRHGDTSAHDRRDLRLETSRAVVVEKLDPLTICNADLGGILGVDFDNRVRVKLTQAGNLTMLAMEERIGSRACGQHERVLLRDFRMGRGRESRLFVVRQGIHIRLSELG